MASKGQEGMNQLIYYTGRTLDILKVLRMKYVFRKAQKSGLWSMIISPLKIKNINIEEV